eukprot:TRINITY_DN9274_c0_g1_i2.p1 TRINITY_DN9274_c0_g1~~TRINITY_DN9274_c0_g1_i2.p1  ORF type:complete len:101 (+),score=11.96 TRINITY_DN9274_c0_g1_i2:35-337(+)
MCIRDSPTLVDQSQSVILTESLAMVFYLLERYDKENKLSGLFGSSERAKLYDLGVWTTSDLEKPVIGYALNTVFLPEERRSKHIVLNIFLVIIFLLEIFF